MLDLEALKGQGPILDELISRLEKAEAGAAAMREAWSRLVSFWGDIEARSSDAHAVYQKEAHRRGDVRHPDAYADLSEATKEWDRVLVRWVLEDLRSWHGTAFASDAGISLLKEMDELRGRVKELETKVQEKNNAGIP